MNREDTKKAIEVMQAWLDGVPCEFRTISSFDEDWMQMDIGMSPGWDFDEFEYRIKPEPREFWIATHADFYLTPTEFESGKWGDNNYVKVREVLDD